MSNWYDTSAEAFGSGHVGLLLSHVASVNVRADALPALRNASTTTSPKTGMKRFTAENPFLTDDELPLCPLGASEGSRQNDRVSRHSQIVYFPTARRSKGSRSILNPSPDATP